MLLDDFFYIKTIETRFLRSSPTASSPSIVTNSRIELNVAHPIYGGHFPDNPIAPGVCLLRIGQELMEKALERELRLVSGDQMKFANIVNPNEHPQLDFELKWKKRPSGDWQVSGVCRWENQTFFKYKAVYEAGDSE